MIDDLAMVKVQREITQKVVMVLALCTSSNAG